MVFEVETEGKYGEKDESAYGFLKSSVFSFECKTLLWRDGKR